MAARGPVTSRRSCSQGSLRGRRLATAVAVLTITVLLAPGLAAAYGNFSAHPAINGFSVQAFQARAAADDWLAETDLNGSPPLGIEVTIPGLLQIKEEEKRMTVAEWIAHGGMSADEPELPASFRHFYDPLANSGVAYLTDHLDDVIEWSGTLGNALIQAAGYFMPALDTKNPQIDAKTWALSHPDNRFSYENAVVYYRDALSRTVVLDPDGQPLQTNAKYGMAWRAVGETMHLVADMTVPAHVRNDSHPDVDIKVTKIGNPDPYESTIGAAEITANATGPASPAINYTAVDLGDLFDSVARWTNANFYSGDTIQLNGLTAHTANGERVYPSPGVPTPEGNYYYRTIDGNRTPILATSLLRKFALLVSSEDDGVAVGTIDLHVLQAQRRLLIPTAIEASSYVIDNFLPRLRAEFEVKQIGTKAFEISGGLVHQPTRTWPTAPAVSNGAYIRYKPANSDAVDVIWLPRESYESGNKVKHTLEVAPGGMVSLHWDLGGYQIRTKPQDLDGVALQISSQGLDAALANRPLKLAASVLDVPADLKTVRIEWTFGDGSAPQTATLNIVDGEAESQVEHTYLAAGELAVTARILHPLTGEPLAEATRQAIVRMIKVQIYPNAITGRVGFPIEASCLPSESQYRYEWTFGDGTTQAGGSSVVQHTYTAAGTYELSVRIADAASAGAPLAEDKIRVQIEGKEGECSLCGHVHGPLEQKTNAQTVWYLDGKGVRQCVYQAYWDDAKTRLREMAVFVDGAREGTGRQYYEDGIIKYETPYVGGKRNGIQREYNHLGHLTVEREYKDDRADGLYTGYHSGGLVKSTQGQYQYFADTKLTQQQGYWVSWHENGNKSKEGEYSRGKQIGTWRYYYVTGQLEIEGAYSDGKNVGTWTWYNTKGEVMRTHTY